MPSDLEFLLSAIGQENYPPRSPVDWQSAQRALNVTLPADYRALIDTMGSGIVNEFLRVHGPEDSHLNLAEINSWVPEALDRISDNGTDYLIDDYILRLPERRTNVRWIQWGSTAGGAGLFWLVSDDESPEEWPTFFHELAHCPYGEFYGVNTTGLLAGLLRGTIPTGYLRELVEADLWRYCRFSE